MGMYKYISEAFQKEYKERTPEYRKRVTTWRRGPTVVKVEKPMNLARARSLGYKAKPGIIVVRVKTGRGQRKRPHPWGGRKPAKNAAYRVPGKSYRSIAEEKASRKYRNLDVLNSYFVGRDGQYQFFEVLMFDAEVYYGADRHAGRAFRGLTAASKKSRGLRGKGNGYEQAMI